MAVRLTDDQLTVLKAACGKGQITAERLAGLTDLPVERVIRVNQELMRMGLAAGSIDGRFIDVGLGSTGIVEAEEGARRKEAVQAAKELVGSRRTRSHNRWIKTFHVGTLVVALGSLIVSVNTCRRQDRAERRLDRLAITRPGSP